MELSFVRVTFRDEETGSSRQRQASVSFPVLCGEKVSAAIFPVRQFSRLTQGPDKNSAFVPSRRQRERKKSNAPFTKPQQIDSSRFSTFLSCFLVIYLWLSMFPNRFLFYTLLFSLIFILSYVNVFVSYLLVFLFLSFLFTFIINMFLPNFLFCSLSFVVPYLLFLPSIFLTFFPSFSRTQLICPATYYFSRLFLSALLFSFLSLILVFLKKILFSSLYLYFSFPSFFFI